MQAISGIQDGEIRQQGLSKLGPDERAEREHEMREVRCRNAIACGVR